MTPKANNQNQAVGLQRALVIGIGGSGAEVIMRVRRHLADHFGSLERIPVIRFLYIDTNPEWFQRNASEIEKDIQLDSSEMVDAQIPDATNLYRGVQNQEYGNYDWLSIDRLQSHTNVINGAGTIRQLGRLCFWKHYTNIRDKASSLLAELNKGSHNRFMQDHHGIDMIPGINIHIAAGLAGGTGSGMFLDAAYLARHLGGLQTIQGGCQTVGYLFMPDSFVGLPATNPIPNGYAALRELNYYSYAYAPGNSLSSLFGQPKWSAMYTDKPSDQVESTAPPFDCCYLLSRSNKNVQLEKEDVFAMVARSLFQEFTFDFSRIKRSMRSNIVQNIQANDREDCPARFMSFGQSAILFPRAEVERLLQSRLALLATQLWAESVAEITGNVGQKGDSSADENQQSESAVLSLNAKAEDNNLIIAVRAYLNRQFISAHGLKSSDMLAAVLKENNERLTDVPYELAESAKQRWTKEEWDYERYVSEVTAAWARWKSDFLDEGPDPMKWGPQIRKLDTNRARVQARYRDVLYNEIMQLFDDTQHGPAFALAATRQLRGALSQIKNKLLNEANDPVQIATQLGDVYISTKAAGSSGGSLTDSIINPRITEELDKLQKTTKATYFLHKRARVNAAAYIYLKFCCFWCRARVEERARRLAAEIVDALDSTLQDIDRKICEQARKLAKLQLKLSRLNRELNDKAAKTHTIGKLLYNKELLSALESKLKQKQGDRYDPSHVAEAALKRLGKSLRDLTEEEIPALMDKLMEEAKAAIGNLDEAGVSSTDFGAYDLLSALYANDRELTDVLKGAILDGAPFIQFSPNATGTTWDEGNDLKTTSGVALHGFCAKPNEDPDTERARIHQAILRSWPNTQPGFYDTADGSQISFFQECGGYPLRAIAGMDDMRKLYMDQLSDENATPLHIFKNEIAVLMPDIFPPKQKLDQALTMKSAGISLGVISTSNVDHGGRAVKMFVFEETNAVTGKAKITRLHEEERGVFAKLLNEPELLNRVSKAIDARIRAADALTRRDYAKKLVAHLDEVEATIAKSLETSVDPQTVPAYVDEERRITRFMENHELSVAEPASQPK
jgi:hypothetical protein